MAAGEEREQLQSGADDSDCQRRSPKQKFKKCLCIFASLFFVLLLVAAIAVLSLLLIVVGKQPARVNTTCGQVDGNYDPLNEVFVFKGMPFAQPPVKDLRWRPPVPMNSSSCKDYKADSFKSECVQLDMASRKTMGSEDCLYLNVYTPTVTPESLLPVMVYIHGGYLQWGEGDTPGYSPNERVTNRMQVVFVSIQYRLNAFGFLVLDELSGKGNYGFLDQVEALRWVQDNIAGFGGDPKKVTIFGQSSGGTSVWALMMSPMAKGLFHRAWIISGSPIYNQTTEQARAANRWITQRESIVDNCDDKNVTEECLKKLSADKILRAIYPSNDRRPTWNILKDSMDLPLKDYFEPALAVVDGTFMPEEPFVMWNHSTHKHNYSDVPVIIGSTAQEIDLNPAPGEVLKHWSKELFEDWVRSRLDAFGNNITNQTLALYPYNHNAELAFVNMTTDVRITCGTDIQAERAARALKSPVYRYVVTSTPSVEVHPLGIEFGSKYAFHMWDTYAFFMAFDVIMPQGPSSSDVDFENVLRKEIKEFVETGKVKSSEWLGYPNRTALLGREISFIDKPFHEERCKFWIDNNFFPYAWIN